MRYNKFETPAYIFWVHHKPATGGKGKINYKDAVIEAAKAQIEKPILINDIEVEILYSTLTKSSIRADIDNVIKPTLDALCSIAYTDDDQVRSVTATLFDRNRDIRLSGRVEHISRLFYSSDVDVLLIAVYSDSRLLELGGEDNVKRKRVKEWEKDFTRLCRQGQD